jgi:alkaline phosphatase D
MLLDLTPQRVVCEWWYVDTVAQPSAGHQFGIAFSVADGTQRLLPAMQTVPPASPPPLAP